MEYELFKVIVEGFLVCYLAIGLAFNFGTMIDDDIRECYFEFGVMGFFIQLIVSSLVFPLVIYLVVSDYYENT